MMTTLLQLALNGVLEGAVYGLLALGLTLVFGVMRIMNISHGDFGIFGAYISYWFLVKFGVDPFTSLTIIVPLLFLLGLLVQRVLISPAISDPSLQVQASVMITWGLALLISNGEIILWSPDYRSIIVPYSYVSFYLSGIVINLPRVLVLLSAVLITGFYVLFLRTKVGKAISACTQDREAAVLMGVNFNKLAGITFGISTATAAISGMLFALTHTLYPALGFQLNLKALTVMVFGGIGSMSGALIGGLVLGMAESIVSFFIGATYKDLVSFLLLVAILLTKPTGIRGKEFFLPR
jgi:branched-chain amino acid transport system permease protein